MFPQVIQLGPLPVSVYGIMVTLAFFVGIWTATRFASQYEHLDKRVVWDFGISVTIAALLGAKLLLVVTDPYYRSSPSRVFSMEFLQSAGVFYGGFLAAVLWAFWFMRRRKLPAWPTADAFAPAIALGHTLGRVGCHAAGCCHGTYSQSFLSVTFTDYRCMVDTAYLNAPLYPTQLMEACANLALFVFLYRFYPRKSFPGQVILLYAFCYSVIRFSLEYFRGDERGWAIPQYLSTSQAIALAVGAVSAWLYFRLRRRGAPAVSGA